MAVIISEYIILIIKIDTRSFSIHSETQTMSNEKICFWEILRVSIILVK